MTLENSFKGNKILQVVWDQHLFRYTEWYDNFFLLSTNFNDFNIYLFDELLKIVTYKKELFEAPNDIAISDKIYIQTVDFHSIYPTSKVCENNECLCPKAIPFVN